MCIRDSRTETEAMARDLPRLPLKAVPYRDRVLQELSLIHI